MGRSVVSRRMKDRSKYYGNGKIKRAFMKAAEEVRFSVVPVSGVEKQEDVQTVDRPK